ncbi:MAG: recombinase RecA [Coprothermobacterota bacterium]|nr:recombinase RecA [Coprothermobacterota bacterium]
MSRSESSWKETRTVDEREKALEVTLAQIEKRFGKGSIMRLGDASHMIVDAISTGALTLDMALGVGGVPRGRIIEIFGQEGSGKSTLVLQIIAEAQRLGGKAAFIDVEHALDPDYAKNLGVDIDELLISQPDYGEQALDIAELLVRSGAIDVLALDSVAALVPKTELEGDMGETYVGLQARLMSQALRKLNGAISRSNTCAIFTNQIREKIGVMFGNPETTPGGRALKFYASVRLEMRLGEVIKVGNDPIGARVKVRVKKNKMAPPFRLAEFDLIFGKGISKVGCILDMALSTNLIQKSGAWFSYNDIRLGQGRENVKSYLEDHPELMRELEEKVRLQAGSMKLPMSLGDESAGSLD